MILKTRTGDKMILMQKTSDAYNIIDGIYALSLTPMYAGQTIKFYSLGEHSCHIFDYVYNNWDPLIKRFTEGRSPKIKLLDLSRRSILLYCLFRYMAHPFMLVTVDRITQPKETNNRIISSFLRHIGHSYHDYMKADPIISYADEQIKDMVHANYSNRDAYGMYFDPTEVTGMIISRWNSVAPYGLYTLNKSEATTNIKFYLPKVKIA